MKLLYTSDGKQILIRAILAVDQNFALGYGDDLLFNNPDDLAMFKSKTINHVCVMGRKTFESIGRILPKRQLVIVTHSVATMRKKISAMKLPADTPMPVVTDTPFADLPKICDDFGNSKIWVCGGASIYEMFRPLVNTWLITKYHTDVIRDHDKIHILPENYEEDKIVYYQPNLGAYTKYLTSTGNFNGIRYGVYAYSRNSTPRKMEPDSEDNDMTKAYNSDLMFYQYLSERKPRQLKMRE